MKMEKRKKGADTKNEESRERSKNDRRTGRQERKKIEKKRR